MESPRVTLFMSVLNEVLGLRATIPAIRRDLLHQILVLDGGSRDGSLEYAREQGLEAYVQRHKGIRWGSAYLLQIFWELYFWR